MSEEWRDLGTNLANYPDLVYEEVEGLTHEQMCYANEEPPWARWSMDLQIRHIALMTPVWLSMRGFPSTLGSAPSDSITPSNSGRRRSTCAVSGNTITAIEC